MNMGVQILLQDPAFSSFGYASRRGITAHEAIRCAIFGETAILFVLSWKSIPSTTLDLGAMVWLAGVLVLTFFSPFSSKNCVFFSRPILESLGTVPLGFKDRLSFSSRLSLFWGHKLLTIESQQYSYLAAKGCSHISSGFPVLKSLSPKALKYVSYFCFVDTSFFIPFRVVWFLSLESRVIGCQHFFFLSFFLSFFLKHSILKIYLFFNPHLRIYFHCFLRERERGKQKHQFIAFCTLPYQRWNP